jgi:hypothetical protein
MNKYHYIAFMIFMACMRGISQDVVSAEYYWDNDPGVGNATSLNVVASGSAINEDFTISTNGLSQGEHLLCVRTMNSTGDWSTVKNQSVHIHNFTDAEYFWDEDPGVGNGQALTLNSTNTDVTSSFSISTNNVNEGWHLLNTRVRGLNNCWSVMETTPVFIENKIVAAEYFWNTDPGVGNGTALDVGTPSSDITFTDQVTTVGLDTTQDIHYLVARTMGQNGAWSVFLDTLIYLGPAIVEDFVMGGMHNIIYPNPARAATTLSLFSTTSKTVSITMESLNGQHIQQIYNGPINGRKDIAFDVSSFPSGIYLMHYVTEKHEWTTRLIVE